MKKFLIMILAGAMLLGGCSSAPEKEPEDNSQQITEEVTDPKELLADMLEPMDAYIMCSVENDIKYSSTDPLSFWMPMFYFVGLYGTDHELAQFENAELKIKASAVEEYASVLFNEFKELPALPEEMSSRITYDETDDTYILQTGDRGASHPVIDAAVMANDGSYVVEASLMDSIDNTVIASGSFLVIERETPAGKYNYSIISADIF